MSNGTAAATRTSIVIVICFAVLVASISAVDSRGAVYVGGTMPGLREKSEGRFTQSDDALTFSPNHKAAKPIDIPYTSVIELEYGQKAGRRVAVGVLVSPLALFSKKRTTT